MRNQIPLQKVAHPGQSLEGDSRVLLLCMRIPFNKNVIFFSFLKLFFVTFRDFNCRNFSSREISLAFHSTKLVGHLDERETNVPTD